MKLIGKLVLLLALLFASTMSALFLIGGCVSSKSIEPENKTTDSISETIEEIKISEDNFIEPPLGFELYLGNFEVVDILEIPNLIMENMEMESGDVWHKPEEMYMNRRGTRNDLTIMFLNIAKVNFDVEFDLAICDTREWLGEKYGRKYDAMPYYEGFIYNIFNLKYYFPIEPLYLYKFEDVFLKLTTLGSGI
jgi:hypothetical protein